MYIAWFYPPGREKIHALGALDIAFWDIKGKALKCRFMNCSAAVRNHSNATAPGRRVRRRRPASRRR